MKYAFILRAGDIPTFEMIDYEDIKNVSERLDRYKELIGCEWIEVVNLPRFMTGSCLIVDEEGALKQNAEFNVIASVLYGTPIYKSPIFGDAILLTTEYTADGIDTVGFDENTATEISALLNSMQDIAKHADESR